MSNPQFIQACIGGSLFCLHIAAFLGMAALPTRAGAVTDTHIKGEFTRTRTLRARSQSDCNGNGIDDRRDRAMGIFEDRDADGVDDWCQSDSAAAELRKTFRLAVGTHPESSYVAIEYASPRGIILKCTGPLKKGIGIRAIDGSSSTVWEIEPRSKSGGDRAVLWVPRYPFGKAIRAGRAFVEFVIGDRTYWRPVAWDWTAFEPE